MLITAIACITENKGLGLNNNLIFSNKDDMNFFKHTTTTHAVIMGARTFQSIGQPLPNRLNIVLSSGSVSSQPGLYVLDDIIDAINFAKTLGRTQAFIIGGASVYAEAINLGIPDRLILTHAPGSPESDSYFPEYEHKYKKIADTIIGNVVAGDTETDHLIASTYTRKLD